MSLDIEKYEKIYKNIDKNFESKFFDFKYPQNYGVNKLNYYKVLNSYLDEKGYGYLSSQIEKFIKLKKVDDVEVAKLLMDCNLINKYNKSMKSNIYDKTIISYKKQDGIRKEFNIEYKIDIPFKILNVVYSNIDFISHKINNIKKEISIEINVDINKSVNFTEIISIYTSYGVDKLEFTVKCEDKSYINIGVDDIDGYFELCRNNPFEAKKIFERIDFINWLVEKDYKSQVINYNDTMSIIKSNKSNSAFDLFCRLNGNYIQYKGIVTSKDKNESIKQIQLDENAVFKEKEILEEKHLVSDKNINNEIIENILNKEKDVDEKTNINKNNVKTENSEKGVLSWIKKKVGLRFNRK